MATPLGSIFSTDEQIVAQGDVTCILRTVKSFVVEFDQAKYEEFLSFGSKSPRARQYRKVSSEIRSQVPSKASPNVCREHHGWSYHTQGPRQRLPQDPRGQYG